MIYHLENNFISIKIKQLGAELCSYYDKETNREIVWQADPKFWKRHAPILFPIIGKVEHNKYKLGKNEFELGQHGFARDQEFRIIKQTKSTITLAFSNTSKTKNVFPFSFKLEIEYCLKGKELKVLYRVQNPSDEKIYFCIGAHPGFNCPFDSNSNFSDYKLTFEKEEKSDRILLSPDGFRTGERAESWLKGYTIQLTEELFKDDALIFDDLKSSYLNIESGKTNEKIKIGWNNYPHIGIWKPLNNAPFLCIEPWNGMADQANLGNDFKDKFGVVKLDSNQSFECFYSVENIIK